MLTKLLPCPFCGGDAHRVDTPPEECLGDNAGPSFIECTRCCACTGLHFDRKENLYSSWNDRRGSAEIERLAERVRVLEGALDGLLNADTVPVHTGYDNGPGGGNFVYKDAILTASDEFRKARAALTGGSHG